MKHILLSLILLSSIPVAGLSAAASAAADVKTKVADVAENPTATVGNSASAAAAPESEVKGKALDAIAQQSVAICQALHSRVMNKAVTVALAGPSWQTVDVALRNAFDQHGTFVPRDITNIMIDYAQSDLRPVRAILADLTGDEFDAEIRREAAPLSAFYSQQQGLIPQHDHALFNFVGEQEGVIFGHGPEVADRWRAAGFQFDSAQYPITNYRVDSVTCPECGNDGSIFKLGHIVVYFDWYKPLDHHYFGCKVRRSIRRAVRAFKRQSKIPIQRTEPQEFANYVMNSVDVCARFLSASHRFEDEDAARARANFLQLLNVVREGLIRVPRALRFAQDPQAWIEAENRRAAELGSPVRYKLPEKPATK